MPMFDMNDAELPRNSELIPDGSFAKVTMTIRPGGVDGQGEHDRGLLKGPRTPGGDVLMLDCEFTVMAGPHARRKFWNNFTVAGGKTDEHGVSIGWKISKGTFRAMIDSALGLNSEDMSEAAKAKRVLRGLSDLDGISFVAKIKVEPASDPRYSASNRLDRVVLATEPEWQKVMNGETVPAQPSQMPAKAAAKPAPAGAAPAWAAPAPAPAAATASRPAWERPAAPAAAPAAAPPPAAAPSGGPSWLNG
jgi:hypothetical protein